jgi:protein-disulfide isomerase
MGRGLVLVILTVLVASGCGGAGGHPSAAKREATPQLRDASSLAQRFAGIPQHGPALGSPRARYTLVEFADLQCPYCARFDRGVLPSLIERFVRTGRLRIELRPVAFLGPDSAPAAAATVAAGMHDRMWQFADLFYRNQGRENSGYVTPRFIGRVAASVPGLGVARLQRASGTPQLRAALEGNARSARTAGISGTPGLRLGRTGGVLAPFSPGPLERGDFIRRLEAATG